MRVIKKGRDLDLLVWRQNVTCAHCESELEIEFADLQVQPPTGGNARDYTPGYAYFKCVVCAGCTQVHSASLPPMMRRRLGLNGGDRG